MNAPHKRTIAIYSPLDPSFVGGFRRWIENFWIPYASTRNVAVRILHCGYSPTGDPQDAQPLEIAGDVEIVRMPSRSFPLLHAPLPSMPHLEAALRGCDVCYVDNGYALHDVFALTAAKKVRVPVISGHHAVIKHGLAHSLVWELIGRHALRRFDAVHVLNSDDSRYLEELGGQTVRRIGLPISEAFFAGAERPHGVQIAFIGRLHTQKGIDRLIEIAKLLWLLDTPEMPVHLVVAGSGPEHYRIAELDGLRNVTYIGPVDGPGAARLLATSHLTLMPSRYETFGIVAAESLAAGTPIVCSNVSGLREMVGLARGYVVRSPDDISAWLAAIGSVLSVVHEPKAYSRLRSACSRYAHDTFTFESIAGQFDRLFSDITLNQTRLAS